MSEQDVSKNQEAKEGEKEVEYNPFNLEGSDPVIFYLGEDTGFWQSFLKGMKTAYSQIKFQEVTVYDSNPLKMQRQVRDIILSKPNAIFFDLSKIPDVILHMIRAIRRANYIFRPELFGMMDMTTDKKFMKLGMLSGLASIHIKSSEIEGIIHDFVSRCFTEKLVDHPFATAKLDDPAIALYPVKLCTIGPYSIEVESNFEVTLNTEYILHSYWSNNKHLLTPKVKAGVQSQEDLYYSLNYAQEFEFVFSRDVDDFFDPEEKIDPKAYEAKKKELEEEAEKARKNITNWIIKNESMSKPKHTKVMVIDKNFTFFKHESHSNDYDFVLRNFNYFKAPRKEISRFRPDLIVYHMENYSEDFVNANEDIAYTLNELTNLENLFKAMRTIEDYEPFVIVFNNCGHNSSFLQERIGYKKIISYANELDPETVIKMGNMLNEKKPKAKPSGGPKIVLHKNTEESYGEIEIPIQVKACSEIDMYFHCDIEELPYDTVLGITFQDVKFFITVAPSPSNPKVEKCYYAIIHGLGEEGRMDLRKFVNSVFFREHDASKQAEIEEFKKKNEEAMKKKAKEDAKAKDQEEKEEDS